MEPVNFLLPRGPSLCLWPNDRPGGLAAAL